MHCVEFNTFNDQFLIGRFQPKDQLGKWVIYAVFGTTLLISSLALIAIAACATANLSSGVVLGGCAIASVLPLSAFCIYMIVKTEASNQIYPLFIAGLITQLALLVISELCISSLLPITALGYAIWSSGGLFLGTALICALCIKSTKSEAI